MIRLNQWSPLIENCAYRHTKAVHVAVETSLFLLLYFRCYIYIYIYKIIKKLSPIPPSLHSYLCNRDSVASFSTCGWSKVATISLATPSFFLGKNKKKDIVSKIAH